MTQDRIWDHFQSDQTESFRESYARLTWIARQFRPGERVLNVGLGGGLFERAGQGRGLQVWCVDPSERAIDAMLDSGVVADRARVGRIESLPFEAGAFDGVVVSEVLEHLDDAILDAGLHELARVLRDAGRLIGTTPQAEDLSAGTVVCPHCGQQFHRWGHRQSYDAARMRSLLSAHGFTVERCEGKLFVPWAHRNWKGRLVGGLRMALSAAGIHGEGENLVFLARRNAGLSASSTGE